MMNHYYFLKTMLVAPIAQLKLSSVKTIFTKEKRNEKKPTKVSNPKTHPWLYFDYPIYTKEIEQVNRDFGVCSCIFCKKSKNLRLFPVFDANEEKSIMSMVSMKYSCDKCFYIIALNQSKKMDALKQMDMIIDVILEEDYKSFMSTSQIFSKALEMKNKFIKMDWIWDFTYLKRRGLSNVDIFYSISDCDFSGHKKALPLLWSNTSSYQEYLKLISTQKKENEPMSI